jgi:hypothetical protein
MSTNRHFLGIKQFPLQGSEVCQRAPFRTVQIRAVHPSIYRNRVYPRTIGPPFPATRGTRRR